VLGETVNLLMCDRGRGECPEAEFMNVQFRNFVEVFGHNLEIPKVSVYNVFITNQF
jgi:hypothetical protein